MKPLNSSASVPAREKWRLLISGQDAGPMVSPLCDDWSLNVPYHWPYDEPDPFPPGHKWHAVSQQMAMAKVCGWEPNILAGVEFRARNPDVTPVHKTTPIDGGSRTESCIRTPLGDLTSIGEQKTTAHTIKAWIETEDDIRKAIWLTRQQLDYDEDLAIAQGRQLRAAIKDRGVLGVWAGAPVANYVNRELMFYQMADWPDAFQELHQATRELVFKQTATLAKAGYDFLFYCVDGTEWISPDFFRTWIRDDTRRIFQQWRTDGRFILWHSCGRIRKFVELGFYNELKPDVFETMSEPPVGDLPSLRWARERLDPAVATKGNIPLNVLLEGTPDDVRREVRRVREQTVGWRHIVGLSDDVLKGTPVENARAFADEARKL
ncbi:MAG TPA: uroporphyrinogen decarboxylase family protein [Planctomycetota bacterium]|nr:uroporphyrinogen decarboxylase family protein [Planctomycetota bacterium]